MFKPMDPLEGMSALEKLHYDRSFDLNSLKHLKTLCVWKVDGEIRSGSATTKLERISIDEATLMQLGSFIVHLPKLQNVCFI